MSVRLAIIVKDILADGTHICHAVEYGRDIEIRPGEGQVLVPWERTPYEYIEISDEVARRELEDEHE